VKQREIQQIIRGAMKAGADSATVNLGDASVVIAFRTNKAAPVPVVKKWDTDDEDKA
jgi:hypothetical protein